jgi:predicted acylesterase/phospholipase RssA
MGALVAAIYSTGMSPAEVRQFVNRVDWGVVLSNPPSFWEVLGAGRDTLHQGMLARTRRNK